MKIRELLQEADDPTTAIKALNAEFKELAAKFDLTLVAGMGWPNITQTGGWFGGGLGSKGGRNKKEETLELPVEARRRGFLKELAKKLEGFLEEGREVKIARGATRSAHTEDAVKGRVLDQLMSNMVEDKPPGNVHRERMSSLVWYVGHSADLVGKTPLYIIVNAYGQPPAGQQYGGPNTRMDFGSTIDVDLGRKLHTAFNKFKKANGEWREYKGNTRIEHNENSKWLAFMRDTAAFASKLTGKKLPDDFDGSRSYFSIDRKFLPKNAPRMDAKQLEELIALLWKHFK